MCIHADMLVGIICSHTLLEVLMIPMLSPNLTSLFHRACVVLPADMYCCDPTAIYNETGLGFSRLISVVKEDEDVGASPDHVFGTFSS